MLNGKSHTLPIASLQNVHRSFVRPDGGRVWAVNGVTMTIDEGRTVAVIGESGSGKSTIARLVLGLLLPDSGAVGFDGTDLSQISKRELRALRKKMGVVFQEPYESLNPRMRVADLIGEPLVIHRPAMSSDERRRLIMHALDEVELDAQLADRYPQALSGGQQQRVGIARALVLQPRLVVLDEPTSSLDLSVRAQMLNLFANLKKRHGLTYLLISHDITTVEYFSDYVIVIYLGHVVEQGPAEAVLQNPQHPYTQALLSARLSADPTEKLDHLPLSGDPPSPTSQPTGCPLVGRCAIEIDRCSQAPVPLTTFSEGHDAACIRVATKN